MVAFYFQLDNETKVSSINAKKKKKKEQGIYLVLLTKKASEIKEFKFAPNVFPANSMKARERARLMKSLLHDRALLQADQRLVKHINSNINTGLFEHEAIYTAMYERTTTTRAHGRT